MNNRTFMKTGLLTLSIACVAALSTGCVERRVVYVPAYQAQPAYQAAPAYSYQPQPAYSPAPAPANPSAPAVAPQAEPQPVAPTDGVVVAQAPPPPQVEVVPVAAGPDYVWAPGYWSIGVGGDWVWAGGHFVIRPHPHAIWVGGGWARHGRTSRAEASWPPLRAASSRSCSSVIASAATRPPPRRPDWTRHFASPTAPPVVRAAPPHRADGHARSHRRSARPRRTAATADAASGTR